MSLADLHGWLQSQPLAHSGLALLLLILVAWLVDQITRRVVVRVLAGISRQTENTFDDALLARGVFTYLAHIAPAAIIQLGVPLVPGLAPDLVTVLRNVAAAFMVLMGTLAAAQTLAAANDVYQRRPIAKNRPLKGYVQLAQIVLYIVAGIVIVSLLVDRSPLLLLSGLGAMTAVLLLVFRDTVLSLVASIQIVADDIVRVGDWIEMPSVGADGEITDIALHTVTVQNWDKTIVRIPTYRLISDSVKNWRGMTDAGGRRIKRALHLDVASIRFLSEAEIERFARYRLLADYIRGKREALAAHNAELGPYADETANHRRLSNIGTFRAYAMAYLNSHPELHRSMTVLVRQLAPTPSGLPLELYCFTATIDWGEYERIASDLFDHLYAILPEFGLRAFQPPTGMDVQSAVGTFSRI